MDIDNKNNELQIIKYKTNNCVYVFTNISPYFWNTIFL